MLIPYVIDQTNNGERSYDIYSRLLEDRIIFIGGEITNELANIVISELLYLEAKDNTKDINKKAINRQPTIIINPGVSEKILTNKKITFPPF